MRGKVKNRTRCEYIKWRREWPTLGHINFCRMPNLLSLSGTIQQDIPHRTGRWAFLPLGFFAQGRRFLPIVIIRRRGYEGLPRSVRCPDVVKLSRCETWNIYAALQIVFNPLQTGYRRFARAGWKLADDLHRRPVFFKRQIQKHNAARMIRPDDWNSILRAKRRGGKPLMPKEAAG
jgi:hypothetical protein